MESIVLDYELKIRNFILELSKKKKQKMKVSSSLIPLCLRTLPLSEEEEVTYVDERESLIMQRNLTNGHEDEED